MRFRLDDNECRFLLQRGPAEDVTALATAILAISITTAGVTAIGVVVIAANFATATFSLYAKDIDLYTLLPSVIDGRGRGGAVGVRRLSRRGLVRA